jgi:tetratricopeptide (TPR) repeat protein
MKHRHIVVTILALLAASAAAQVQSPEQLFQQANAYYQQGNYTAAAETYESILKTGVFGGELYFNLGNAYYKQGNMGKAILNYERALRIMPADDDLQHNLQLANLLVVDKIEVTPRLFIWDWWDGIKAWFSLSGSTWLVYVLFVLLAGALVAIILARSFAWRKIGFLAALVAGVLLLFAVLILVDKARDTARDDEAIVVATITTIKNSPDEKSSDAFVLHAGVKVRITDSVNTWVKIRLADGKVGWMDRSAAERI